MFFGACRLFVCLKIFVSFDQISNELPLAPAVAQAFASVFFVVSEDLRDSFQQTRTTE